MFHVEIQARLTNGAVMTVSATSEDRRTAIRRGLDSMPLGSVAISTVVTSSGDSSRLFVPSS